MRPAVPVAETVPGFAEPAGLFMAGRVINLVVGLAMIPFLVHSLGGIEFATWAILLSCSIVVAQLHLGVPTALAFEVAVAARSQPDAGSRLWSSAAAYLAAINATVLPLLIAFAPHLGVWLRLPSVGRWHPGVVLVAIFVCVAVRSVLLTGGSVLLGFFRFREAATLALAQALLSNASAVVVAAITGDLAATLVAFWVVQLAVAAVTFVIARRTGSRPAPRLVTARLTLRLLRTGITFQIAEWAQTINFQFDKFVVVRLLGLWPAALYEVSNRSVLALRSIPASSTETMMPVAARSAMGGLDFAQAYRMVLFALHSALLFCIAPCVVAPIFLYAWVGEMGYVSRYVFVWLAIGAAANLIALPIAMLTQAAAYPRAQARAAIASMVVNVFLSVVLACAWGLAGAALGSCVAMVVGTSELLREARTPLGPATSDAARLALSRHLPVIAVCVLIGIVVHLAFDRWVLALSPGARYTIGLRIMAAFAAVGIYVAVVFGMIVTKLKFVGFEADEREFLTRLTGSMARLKVS